MIIHLTSVFMQYTSFSSESHYVKYIVILFSQTLWSEALTKEIFRPNRHKKTPLHLAVEHGHVR